MGRTIRAAESLSQIRTRLGETYPGCGWGEGEGGGGLGGDPLPGPAAHMSGRVDGRPSSKCRQHVDRPPPSGVHRAERRHPKRQAWSVNAATLNRANGGAGPRAEPSILLRDCSGYRLVAIWSGILQNTCICTYTCLWYTDAWHVTVPPPYTHAHLSIICLTYVSMYTELRRIHSAQRPLRNIQL